ncbi:high mobility group nucleosome-binding domain-containing protein 5-like [Helianthus annuus]|uniref:high mobility group nucleosome-binding domain-containing protein 5-like n=1 Tax=Helianthus annuus TaxID=4232 RepID=UPI000B90A47E|nr:high mobility group nucleosome-binding domain-containing protein 5-like [Helianthus annuus]
MDYDIFVDQNDKRIKDLENDVKIMIAVIESLVLKNERLRKITRDLEEDKKLKDKKMEMLYKVLERRLGINIEVEFNKIEIEEAEARNAERVRKAASEPEVVIIDKGKNPIDVIPEVRPELEKEPEPIDITKFILVPSTKEPEEEEEKEDDEEIDDKGPDHDDDDKGDDDNNTQGRTGLIVYEPKSSESDAQNKYMNDAENQKNLYNTPDIK